MTEVLSEKEIDDLLAAINADSDDFDLGAEDAYLEETSPFTSPKRAFESIEDFESFLTERKFKPEQVYGTHSFQKAATMCRFFDSKNGDSILADIERKNKEQNMGNIIVPNTGIKLINYSICPKCRAVFSFKDLMDYYRNPKPDAEYKNKGHQIREDTRVCCPECEEYFLPTLVISDGLPKNEVQFLCRVQTVEAIEKFFLGNGQEVLSRNKSNILKGNGFITIRNDVELQKMESRPTLISNMLQYTPPDLMVNLIDGTNVEKGDILFGKWKPVFY